MEVLASGNYATCVSFRPFVVTNWARRQQAPAADGLIDLRDAAGDEDGGAAVECMTVPCHPITARCYQQPSAELSSLGFETMFAVKCLAKKLDIPRTDEPAEVYVAIIWCLLSDTHYTVSYAFTDKPDESDATEQRGMTDLTTTRLTSVFVDKAMDAHFVQDVAVLNRSDVVDMLNAQGDHDMLFMWPPEPRSLASMSDGLRFLLYDALFALPEPLAMPTGVMWLLQLPNGAKRYVLDFAPQAASAPAPSPAPSPLFPWRRHSKVRKLIRDGAAGKYAVVVHDTKDGVLSSLARARNYHTDLRGGTWLSDAFNNLLATTADMCRYENSAYVTYGTPGLHLLCIELVEQPSGKVLAGCCGFACGAVYHDYTMYTLDRSAARFGTFLTKLIGEALQKCGYDLWYWGFRLGYMADYERHYGGVDMDRAHFYQRWCAARDRLPTSQESVWDFLRAGRGMVPALSTAPTSVIHA